MFWNLRCDKYDQRARWSIVVQSTRARIDTMLWQRRCVEYHLCFSLASYADRNVKNSQLLLQLQLQLQLLLQQTVTTAATATATSTVTAAAIATAMATDTATATAVVTAAATNTTAVPCDFCGSKRPVPQWVDSNCLCSSSISVSQELESLLWLQLSLSESLASWHATRAMEAQTKHAPFVKPPTKPEQIVSFVGGDSRDPLRFETLSSGCVPSKCTGSHHSLGE